MLLGIDTSHFEKALDWNKLKTQSQVAWAYTKASQGSEFIDPMLKAHSQAAAAAGVLNGCYHFFMANVDPTAQVANFLTAIQGLKFNLPFILDWEDGGVQGVSISQQVDCAQVILDAMEDHMRNDPRRTIPPQTIPWIYMGEDLEVQDNLPAIFSRYPLINAHYGVKLPQVRTVLPWTRMTAWQYTSSAILQGVPAGHTVDANQFFGNMSDLQKYCAL